MFWCCWEKIDVGHFWDLMGYLILKLSGILGTKTFSPKIHFFLKIVTHVKYTQKDMIHQNVHTMPIVTMVKNYELSKKPCDGKLLLSFGTAFIGCMLLAAHVALCADSGHFVMPPLVSLEKDIWGRSAEIPHWWHVTTQIWVVLLIGWKFASTNQSEALLRSGQWRIISIKFLQSFLRHHFEEPAVTWQNGGCFVRPLSQVIKTSWKIQKNVFFAPSLSNTNGYCPAK